VTSKRRHAVSSSDERAWLSSTANDPTGEALIVSGIIGLIYSRLVPRGVQVFLRRRVRLVVAAMWLPVFGFLVFNAWTQCGPR